MRWGLGGRLCRQGGHYGKGKLVLWGSGWLPTAASVPHPRLDSRLSERKAIGFLEMTRWPRVGSPPDTLQALK